MAAPNVAPNPHQVPQPHFPNIPAQQQLNANNAAFRERMQHLIQRANQLRAGGATVQNNEEFAKIWNVIQNLQQRQRQEQAAGDHSHPGVNGQASMGPIANGVPATNGNALTAGPVSNQLYPQAPQTPVSFTPDQINALRAQIHAFKLISRGMPVPEPIQQAIRVPNQAIPDIQTLLHGADVNARVIDSAVKIHKSTNGTPVNGVVEHPPVAEVTPAPPETIKEEEIEAVDPEKLPKGPLLEEDVNSGIYPYNAYTHPFTFLKRDPDVSPALWATKMQRLLVPSVMPVGLDPHQVIEERNAYIDARIEQRMRELEAMPAMMGDGGLENPLEEAENAEPQSLEQPAYVHPPSNTHGKLRALIELKALRVVDKQRQLRASVAERLMHGTLLPLNRADFRRTRKVQLRDIHNTEVAERKQRMDRERRAKQKHIEQLGIICTHGREVLAVGRAAQERVTRLGKAVLSFHAHTEKEEQKRIERLAKERLKALKNDDEEAYMKLIDTAKDTRITHLLKQTDAYLDSLAQAVVEQQRSEGHEAVDYDMEEGPVSEATFGAKAFSQEEDKGKLDYYAVAHRLKEKISAQPSILVGGTLKDYQLKGLQWMVSLYNNKLNGILADEMGLGKTIQTISLITFLIESKKQRGPYLVIVPLSTMTNWSSEFAKWAPSVKMISYKGNPAQRKVLQTDLRTGNFQVVLTTYEYIIKDRIHLSRMKWIYMIIDEGHRMKNTQSKLAQTLTQYYHSRYRLILTGTPLQNNLPELWALLNFALPKVFNSVKSFDEWFNTPFANSGTGDKIELNEEEALLIIRRLHKVLRPFLLRRLKKDVESELPDKVEKVIKVRMSALQSQLYKQMKKYKMIADGKDAKGKPGGVKGLSNELMQLRKICQHPFLFESVEDRVNPSSMIDDKLIRSSGKIELLSRILPKFFATGHRVLIFFQMTKVMDIMEDFLKMMGWKYLRLDGGTKTEDRAGHVQLFNAPNSEYKVFILSTRAGGLGLNLQTADTVIIFDSDWNPHADLQAQDRAHRIGQTKVVRILRFITEKSVEESMFARARYKLDIDDKVIQAGRFDNKSTQEEQEEFLRSILEADQEEENEEAGDMNDDEINEIIARSDEEAVIFHEIDVQREREALEKWRRAGNRGKPPPPLMQLEELPECYRADEPFAEPDAIDELEGRGHRRRTVVNYNDGLSDDQWALALEEGEDLQELSERAREKKERRAQNKLLKDIDIVDSPGPDLDTPRGSRKNKKGKGKVPAADFDLGTPASSSKRKRGGGKSTSMTPSLIDDEDDERDTKRRKTKQELPPPIKEKMKKALNDVHKAVQNLEDETGRRRSDLFRELPDRREYPDYYQLIQQPIALSTIRKRISSHYYKNVLDFREDMRLMFNNARTYNQEGSWVYVDAEEMEKVFDAAFAKHIVGSGLPGAPSGSAAGGSSGGYDSALTPVDDDDSRPAPSRSKSARKQVISDDEYMTPSDEE
ncbi:SNF2 family N-terminal domain-containing protein [Dichomitus squalens]|nr:SNF2 family N-terminal domain-containing protein [Dichomitus squalens]